MRLPDERETNCQRCNETEAKMVLNQGQLQVYEAKVKRLKQALKHVASMKNSDKRILMAQASVEQLKSIIEEKNKVIQKYRNRCISTLGQTPLKHEGGKEKRVEVLEDDLENLEKMSTLPNTTLINQLNEASSVLDEKEEIIRKKQNEINICKERNEHLERRNYDVIKEMEEMKSINNFLKDRLCEAENCTNKLGKDQTLRLESLEEDNNNYERLLNEMKLDSNLKEEKMSRLKSSITTLKKSLKEHEENAKNVPVLKSEINKMKIELNICRRSRDRWERALSVSKSKAADVVEDVGRLENQVRSLRKETVDAKQMKFTALNRSKRIAKKLKEVQESIQNDKERHRNCEAIKEIEGYKSRIQTLKKDNAKLRGIVASYSLKNEKLQQEREVILSSNTKVKLLDRSNTTHHRNMKSNIRKETLPQKVIDKSTQTHCNLTIDQECYASHSEEKYTHKYEYEDELINEAKTQIPDLFRYGFSEQKQEVSIEDRTSTLNLKREVELLLEKNYEYERLLEELQKRVQVQEIENSKLEDALSNMKKKYLDSQINDQVGVNDCSIQMDDFRVSATHKFNNNFYLV